MKFTTIACLLGATSAQLLKCESNETCWNEPNGYYKDGCCGIWTVIDTKPGKWGQFASIWGGEKNIFPGANFKACTGPQYLDAHFRSNPDGRTNNYEDLGVFLDNVPGARKNLGLPEGANVDDWIKAWNGSAETQKNFQIQMLCVPGSRFDPKPAMAEAEAGEYLRDGSVKLASAGAAALALASLY